MKLVLRLSMVVALGAMAFGATIVAPSAAMADDTVPIDLARAVPLGIAAGDGIVLRGSFRTTFDGVTYDAATRTQGAVTTLGGLYDLAGGGLRLADADSIAHVVKVVATGEDAPACRAAGVSAPCLVPRTSLLAHERLLSLEEFQRTLVGAIDGAELRKPEPFMAAGTLKALMVALSLAMAAAAAVTVAFVVRGRRRSPLGQVKAAARDARAISAGDASLDPVRAEIDALLARANALDRAHRDNYKKLAKIDRREIDRNKRQWASSTSPEAAEVCRWLAAESAEADRLDRDLAISAAGLEQIAASLRVIALSAREHRGVKLRVGTHDPLENIKSELEMRDRARDEMDHAAE